MAAPAPTSLMRPLLLLRPVGAFAGARRECVEVVVATQALCDRVFSHTRASSSAVATHSSINRQQFAFLGSRGFAAQAATPTAEALSSPRSALQQQGDGLVIDESAVQRLRQLQRERGSPVRLRIEVEGGGCSGFQYKFSLDSSALSASDMLFGPEDAAVVCDTTSFDLLRGARIEWEESLMRSAFVVGTNPNSEASCGCGSSFTARVVTPVRKQAAAAPGAAGPSQ